MQDVAVLLPTPLTPGGTQCIRASVSGSEGSQLISIEQRVNRYMAHDHRRPIEQRAATFDGDEYLCKAQASEGSG